MKKIDGNIDLLFISERSLNDSFKAKNFILIIWVSLPDLISINKAERLYSMVIKIFLQNCCRSSPPEVFLSKGVLKMHSKFSREHPCRSVISIKLLCTFFKNTYAGHLLLLPAETTSLQGFYVEMNLHKKKRLVNCFYNESNESKFRLITKDQIITS